MQIKNIQINGFGKLKDVNLDLNQGINLIKGSNEAGKSTLTDFIKCSFYGISKNKNGKEYSDYDKYLPWGNETFAGSISYNIKDEEYTINRNFLKGKTFVYDKFGTDISSDFGKDKNKGADAGTLQLNMDEDSFVNTILIKQNQISVNTSEQNAIIQKLSNVIQTGDESYSYEEIIKKLEKKLYDEVGTERTSTKPKYSLKRDVSKLECEETELESNKRRSLEIASVKEKNSEEIEKLKKELQELKDIYDSKERCEKEIYEEKLKFDIEQKAKAEKNQLRQKKIKIKKTIDIILIIVEFTVLCATFIAMNNYALAVAMILLCPIMCLFDIKVGYKEEIEADTDNFDLICENIKKKYKKEMKAFEKDENKKSFLEMRITELKKVISENEAIVNEKELDNHKLKIEEASIKSGVDRLNEVVEELYYKKDELSRVLLKEEKLNIGIATLRESYEEIKKKIIPDIEKDIQYTVSKTTNGKYKEIKYNDINGLVCKNELGEITNIDKLSLGTLDQIYLGFRLAIADKYESLPVIFDESFVYFDDNRLENMLKTISEISETRQIIILSCSCREEKILDKLDIKYKKITL